jgi:ABC-type bacteriocin/lantibiotic exporter with double-glycine peptidase domain
MDCGPASLKCLLEGFGVPVSYGRLREACQTSVDGTSIDTLEEIANQLGLDAEQVMLPADHLLLSEAEALPAIVVVRLPWGDTHFVVVWSCTAGFVQVMDPSRGRSFMRIERFMEELYIHRMIVPAADFREHAGSDSFLKPLASRLSKLGVPGGGKALLGRGVADPTVRTLVAIDAATRMAEALTVSGGLPRDASAAQFVEALVEEELARPPEPPVTDFDEQRDAEAPIPAVYWTVRPAPPDEEGEQLWVRGAVLVQVKGVRAGTERTASLPPELALALAEPPARPGRVLWSMLREDGLLAPSVLAFGLALVGGAALVEALLFRGLFEITWNLGVLRQRLAAALALLVFTGLLLALEAPIASGLARLGRHLEARLRIAFLRKIPRLGDRYFQSRPTSDMIHRSHFVHLLRALPGLGGLLVRSTLELLVTVAGLIWLDPRGAPLALLVAAVSVGVPIALAPMLTERDLRLRTHAGALSRFYLDALLGMAPVRAHSAERALRREHEGVLTDWVRASRSLLHAAISVEAVQAVVGFLCAGALVLGHLSRASDPSRALLLLYWSLNLPVIGEQIALLVRRYPSYRNITLRLLEPLGALDETEPVASGGTDEAAPETPVSIRFEGVRAVAAGHTILEKVNLTIAPGEHVAIVGPSGAGKSSLVGLLLGWHRPEEGTILVDGVPLESARLAALRRATVWVDPAVQLFNRPLYDNLRYGQGRDPLPMMRVIEEADLRRLLELLPQGLQTPLGEGGALVSGGEGQRVRFGRALYRGATRLVILDEPFRGLDREKRHEFLARARALWSGATLLTITHDVGETRSFPRVLVIEGGHVVEDGTPEELRREGTRYRALLDAEDAVRQGLWQGPEWRHLRIERGHLVTLPREPPP